MKQEIFEKAHLGESSELARNYFKELGLDYTNITLEQYDKLRDFIQQEMYILLSDSSYHMVKDLRMDEKIVIKNGEVSLYTNGSYFIKRQAISFEKNGFIGFCGWADGCNRIPFIIGFVKLCDYIKVGGYGK